MRTPTDIIEQNLYLTNDKNHLLRHIKSRINKYGPTGNLRDGWPNASFDIKNGQDEVLLKIFDLEVMSTFEAPYMKKLAEVVASQPQGDILNVGFGLGLVDNYIEELAMDNPERKHHIIELNHGVCQLALKWKESQPNSNRIHVHYGDWREVLPKLKNIGLNFGAVVYDAFPLEVNELCRDSVEFLVDLIRFKLVQKDKGIITFYMDSTNGFSQEYLLHLKLLGVGTIKTEKIALHLPNRKVEYWNKPYFIVPILSDITY